MKRVLKWAMITVCSLFLCTACQNNQTIQKPEGERETFVMGFDTNYPPYTYMNEEQEFAGFDIDMAEEVAKRLDMELEKKIIVWSSKEIYLNNGEIDAIWSGFTMTGREDLYTFSQPYLGYDLVFVVRADSGIETFSDLEGKIVMTQVESASHMIMETPHTDIEKQISNSIADLQLTSDFDLAFGFLKNGNVDAVLCDSEVSKYYISMDEEHLFHMMEEKVARHEYAIGFKLGNTKLRDTIQEVLDEIKADGTLEKILANYEDTNLPNVVYRD